MEKHFVYKKKNTSKRKMREKHCARVKFVIELVLSSFRREESSTTASMSIHGNEKGTKKNYAFLLWANRIAMTTTSWFSIVLINAKAKNMNKKKKETRKILRDNRYFATENLIRLNLCCVACEHSLHMPFIQCRCQKFSPQTVDDIN